LTVLETWGHAVNKYNSVFRTKYELFTLTRAAHVFVVCAFRACCWQYATGKKEKGQHKCWWQWVIVV